LEKSNEKRRLVQISSSYFTAGIILEGKKVVKAAPILKYMLGWTLSRVLSYCKYKRWSVECVE